MSKNFNRKTQFKSDSINTESKKPLTSFSEKNYKNVTASFKDYETLINEEVHNFKDVSISMFEKHQIWACRAFSTETSTISDKHRMYYIINPNIGYGKILAAPISYSYHNGIPIEIGKNKLSHIICTNMIMLDTTICDFYVGVAPIKVRESVDLFLQFLITGNTNYLSEEVVNEYDKQLEIFKEKDGTYFTAFQGVCNERNFRVSKNIRNTKIGEAVDIRDIYLYNIEKNGTLKQYARTYCSEDHSMQNDYTYRDEPKVQNIQKNISLDYTDKVTQNVPEIVKLLSESKSFNSKKTYLEKYIVLEFSTEENIMIFTYTTQSCKQRHYDTKYKLLKMVNSDAEITKTMEKYTKISNDERIKKLLKHNLVDLKNIDIFSFKTIDQFLKFRSNACELFIVYKNEFEKVKPIYEKFVELRNSIIFYKKSI